MRRQITISRYSRLSVALLSLAVLASCRTVRQAASSVSDVRTLALRGADTFRFRCVDTIDVFEFLVDSDGNPRPVRAARSVSRRSVASVAATAAVLDDSLTIHRQASSDVSHVPSVASMPPVVSWLRVAVLFVVVLVLLVAFRLLC